MATSPIEKFIYDYEKRKGMKQVPAFERTMIIWENGQYLTSNKVGDTSYIIRKAHEKKEDTEPGAILTIEEWERAYFESGTSRKEILLKNKNANLYQYDQYYGRTIDELTAIAKNFYEDLTQKHGIKLTQQAALNIVYIKVIDDAYSDYMRSINVIKKFQQQYPNFKFYISDALTKVEQAIDIEIFNEKGNLIRGVQTLPESFEKNTEKNMQRREQFDQQHEAYKDINDVNVDYVYASAGGYIKGQLPSL